jgi:hypothetical protein
MISIINSNIKSDDVTKIKEAVLRLETEIVQMSKRPNFYDKEIKNKKIVLRSYRRLVAIHEAKQGGKSFA